MSSTPQAEKNSGGDFFNGRREVCQLARKRQRSKASVTNRVPEAE